MSKRFIDMGPNRRLVALDTASCDAAFSLIRRIAVERSDPAWSAACDEALADFLRDWDQGAIAIHLREHLGDAQLGSLVDAALEVSRGGGVGRGKSINVGWPTWGNTRPCRASISPSRRTRSSR